MRINILCAMALFCAVYANAQKNTWMIYGGGTYDNQDYLQSQASINSGLYQTASPQTYETLLFNSGVGYSISDHFMVGLQGGYGRQEYLYIADNVYYFPPNGSSPYTTNLLEKQQETTWSAGVFARYNSWVSKRIYVYGQMFAGKYGISYKTIGIDYANTPRQYVSISPDIPDGNGITVSLFPAVGIEVFKGYGVHMDVGGISYTSYNTTTTASDLHHFNVTLGSQFSFGVHKIIGWKKYSAKPQATTPTGK